MCHYHTYVSNARQHLFRLARRHECRDHRRNALWSAIGKRPDIYWNDVILRLAESEANYVTIEDRVDDLWVLFLLHEPDPEGPDIAMAGRCDHQRLNIIKTGNLDTLQPQTAQNTRGLGAGLKGMPRVPIIRRGCRARWWC